MLSEIPISLEDISPDDIDKEILRLGIIAEYDAVNLYEQMASMTDNDTLKEVLLDIAKEEKTHVGEFQALLVQLDSEQATEMSEGASEVEEMMSEASLIQIVEEAVMEVLGQSPPEERRVRMTRGVPLRDGSGRGQRLNRGRGGCPPESQRPSPRSSRPDRMPDGIGRGQGGEGRGQSLRRGR